VRRGARGCVGAECSTRPHTATVSSPHEFEAGAENIRRFLPKVWSSWHGPNLKIYLDETTPLSPTASLALETIIRMPSANLSHPPCRSDTGMVPAAVAFFDLNESHTALLEHRF